MHPLIFYNAAREIVFLNAPYVVIGKEDDHVVVVMTSAHLDIADNGEKHSARQVSTVTEPHLVHGLSIDDFIEAYNKAAPQRTTFASKDPIDLRPLQIRRKQDHSERPMT